MKKSMANHKNKSHFDLNVNRIKSNHMYVTCNIYSTCYLVT